MGCCDDIPCVLDIAEFRATFIQFSDETKFPDATIQAWWDLAQCYFSTDCFSYLNGSCLCKAIYLLTAHLGAIAVTAGASASGTITVPGMVNSATIDKVSVSMAIPELVDQFQWWLQTTTYGQQLLALLQVVMVGGMTIGGLPETQAIRKVGGIFWR